MLRSAVHLHLRSVYRHRSMSRCRCEPCVWRYIRPLAKHSSVAALARTETATPIAPLLVRGERALSPYIRDDRNSLRFDDGYAVFTTRVTPVVHIVCIWA